MLREFFRQEYISFHSLPSHESFMENYVDRRIDQFLEESKRGMEQVEQALEECRRIRELLLIQAREVSRELRREFRESFRVLDERVGRLRKQLTSVLPPTLRYKSGFEPHLEAPETSPWLGREMSEIEDRFGLVRKHLESFLYGSRPVVAVEDLGDRDILVQLFEMRKLCRLAGNSVMGYSLR